MNCSNIGSHLSFISGGEALQALTKHIPTLTLTQEQIQTAKTIIKIGFHDKSRRFEEKKIEIPRFQVLL
jgi:hypothetical protein